MRPYHLAVTLSCTLLWLGGCGGGSGDDGGGGPPPPPANVVPTANAGPDQSVNEGDVVTLTGTGTDADGSISTFAWLQTAGPAVALSATNVANPPFPSPTPINANQVVTLRLTVTDNRGGTGTDDVTINVDDDTPPVAVAGTDQAINEELGFVLDAAGSTDDEGIASYTWTQVTQVPGRQPLKSGFCNLISQLCLKAPEVFVPETYEFEVQVTDRLNQTSTDRVTVTFKPNPPDINRFIAFLNKDSDRNIETQQTADAYYAAVDPFGTRTTLTDWKREVGFNAGFSARAAYRNAADLGFGRAMYLRTNANGDVASYVENFETITQAVASVNTGGSEGLIATVAMEWAPIPPPRPAGAPSARYVKFYVFGPDGKRITNPDLDGRGPKFVPGVCNVCHGGQSRPLVSDAGTLKYPEFGFTDAQFLPWDVNSFEFSNDPSSTRAALEPQFKKLNQGALSTYPVPPLVAGTFDSAAVIELVQGWYGGVGMPSPIYDGSFTPENWKPAKSGNAKSDLIYHDVVALNCRACHVQRGTTLLNKIAFRSYGDFNSYRERIKTLVFDQGTMPLARLTFDNFWREHLGIDAAKILAEELAIDSTLRRPGMPVADPGPSRMVTPGDFVSLLGGASLFAKSFKWSFRDELFSRPIDSEAAILGDTFANAALLTDLIGSYKLQLEVSNDIGTSAPVPVDIVAFNGLGPLSFATDIVPILTGNPNPCVSCHKAGGTPGIPIHFDNPATQYGAVRRYVNLSKPVESPILMKASGAVPHVGGNIAGFESSPLQLNKYQLMMKWILEGAKNN